MTNYVIVIVDNKRALAAYQKGMDDLDLIWPQIEAYCKEVDEPVQKQFEAEMKALHEINVAHTKEVEEYRRLMKIYEQQSSRTFLPFDRKPIKPTYPHYPVLRTPDLPFLWMKRFKSIRAELKHMHGLAGAAITPYRMTETRVNEMIRWEDGSEIDEIKRTISMAKEFV
jgi:hypothetical protein